MLCDDSDEIVVENTQGLLIDNVGQQSVVEGWQIGEQARQSRLSKTEMWCREKNHPPCLLDNPLPLWISALSGKPKHVLDE